MVKFTADVNGRTLIGLGITAGNIKRLKQGMPIHIHLEEMNLPWKADVMIVYGETEQAIADDFKANNLLGPNTIINREKRSQ